MPRTSNVIITILNAVFLIVGVVAICFGIWFHVGANNSNLCNRILQKPLLYVGLALFVVSLLGFIGSCYRFSFFLWIYLALIFFFIVSLMCFTVFSIMVTNKEVGKTLSTKGYQGVKIGDFQNWLHKYMFKGENGDNIKSCLVKAEFCQKVADGRNADKKLNSVPKTRKFLKTILKIRNELWWWETNLSSTLAGCCKPPTYCGLQFQNETFWLMPKEGPAVPDSDCKTWSNVQTNLCFECKSCKATIIENIKNEWGVLATINVINTVILIIIFSMGCSALKNNRHKKKYQHP